VRPRAWTLLALAAVAALPVVADRLRSGGETCALDGVAVHPGFRVRVVPAKGPARHFCGVRCAEAWLGRSGADARAILVTDCASGREIDAREAWYLETAVGVDGAPDLVRVFARRVDAERHLRARGGVMLIGSRRPFPVLENEGGA